MTISKKNSVLWLVLAVTLGLVWHASSLEDANPQADIVVLAKKSAQNVSLAVKKVHDLQQANSQKLTLRNRELLKSTDNLFANAGSILPPQTIADKKKLAPPALVPVTEAPLAPPLPFKYLGRWAEGELETFSLEYQGEVVLLKQGQDYANYRLVSLEKDLSGMSLKFLYLPLNEFQTLNIQMPS